MSQAPEKKALTVRLPPDLYERAQDLAALRGVSIRSLFERALEREIELCRSIVGEDFDRTIEQIRSVG